MCVSVCRWSVEDNRHTFFYYANYPDFYILFFIILFFPETEFQVIKIKGATPYDAAPQDEQFEREKTGSLCFDVDKVKSFQGKTQSTFHYVFCPITYDYYV